MEQSRGNGSIVRHAVLLVGDASLRSKCVVSLDSEGCQVKCVSNAAQARETLARARPSLFIVALEEPVANCLALLREARAISTLADLRVVVLVGQDVPSLVEDCIALRIDDFLREPFDEAELRFRVGNQLRHHELGQRSRKLTQHLRDCDELQRILLDNLTAGVVIVDAQTGVAERMNRAAASMFGGKAEGLSGRLSHANMYAPQVAEYIDPHEGVANTECHLLRIDGTRLPILKSVRYIELDGRTKFLETFVDLSDQQLRDGLYRAIFEHSFDAVMTIHARTRSFSSANPACLNLFGAVSEYDFLLRAPSEYCPEFQQDGKRSATEYERLIDVALNEGHVAFDWTYRKLDGTEFEASVLFMRMRHGIATQLQVIVRDISEQRRVERQLEQERLACVRLELEMRATQKLEAVGQLAAGIAHEINTPTQFASDSVHFLRDAIEAQQTLIERCRELKLRLLGGEAPEDIVAEFDRLDRELDIEYLIEQGPAAVTNAIEGLSRIAAIVRAMKEFSHPDGSEKSLVDINAALKNTLIVARNEYKYVADIDADYGELPEVPCHLGALNQVFLNLIINAAHAVADRVRESGAMGTIGIKTRIEDGAARIDISDSGIGIPESLRSRVFEPFFTTKEVGRGTGQGLAIARSIVCGRHGGTIAFESEVNKGTTFTICIPLKGEAS